MARPLKGEEHKYVRLSVRVTPAAWDRLCRLSAKQDESLYALGGRIIERVMARFEPPISRQGPDACYPASSPSSTLSGLLSESPSQGRIGSVSPSSRR